MIGFSGNGRLDAAEMTGRYGDVMLPGESIAFAYRSGRCTWLLTSRRMIVVDSQGMTGKKMVFESVPYRNVLRFAMETAGMLDSDNELRIWLPALTQPWTIRFKSPADLAAMHAVLARNVLGAGD